MQRFDNSEHLMKPNDYAQFLLTPMPLPSKVDNYSGSSPSYDAKFFSSQDNQKLNRLDNGLSFMAQKQGAVIAAQSNATSYVKNYSKDNNNVSNNNSNIGSSTLGDQSLFSMTSSSINNTGDSFGAEPKPKPKRPLSAYNIFFKYERRNILDQAPTRPEGKPRRSHGKIGFADLARQIAGKWNGMDANMRQEFVEMAAKDKERYNREMEVYKIESNEFFMSHASTTIMSVFPGKKYVDQTIEKHTRNEEKTVDFDCNSAAPYSLDMMMGPSSFHCDKSFLLGTDMNDNKDVAEMCCHNNNSLQTAGYTSNDYSASSLLLNLPDVSNLQSNSNAVVAAANSNNINNNNNIIINNDGLYIPPIDDLMSKLDKDCLEFIISTFAKDSTAAFVTSSS